MRHQKSGRQLGRNSSHRKAMFKNMSASLIQHELIKTTHAKAKELRRVIEPLITLSKEDSVSKRRVAFARIRDIKAVTKLFTVLGPRYTKRPGGYVRVLKCGFRPGDSAPMAIVELVDRPSDDEDEVIIEEKKSVKKSSKSSVKKEAVAKAPKEDSQQAKVADKKATAQTTPAEKTKPTSKESKTATSKEENVSPKVKAEKPTTTPKTDKDTTKK